MHAPMNGDPTFQVVVSEYVGKKLRVIQRRESKAGRGAAVLAAFEQMIARLTMDPFHFGEPLYHLPYMQLDVRHAAISPLLIYFGVHQAFPIVFIKDINLLPRKAP
jgi:hypothetical protein